MNKPTLEEPAMPPEQAMRPLAAWEFASVADDVVKDAGSDGNRGILVGGPTIVRGRGTGALNFDGVDDYVQLDKPLPQLPSMTIEVWACLDKSVNAGGSPPTILCDSDEASGADFWLGLEPQAAVVCASKNKMPLGDGENSMQRVPLPRDIRGSWVQLVWVMTPQQSSIFLDGKLVAAIDKGGSNEGNHFIHPSIGSWYGGPRDSAPRHGFFKGQLEAVRVYPAALTPQQVAQLLTNGGGTLPVRRRALPVAASIEVAIKALHDELKADYAARGADKKKSLAEMLWKAVATETDSARRFVMLREARDLYASSGSVAESIECAQAISNVFIVDPSTMKLEALAILSRVATGDNAGSIVQAATAVSDTLASAGTYPDALKALTLAETAAKTGKASEALDAVKSQERELKELIAQWRRVEAVAKKLEVSPDDPEANFRVGRFYCFTANSWERGLPMLAKSSDTKLKSIAARDLANPTEKDAMLEVADGWWDYATQNGSAGAGAKLRAVTWYEQVLPKLEGQKDLAARVRQRMDQVQTGTVVNLLKILSAQPEKLSGNWTFQNGGLAARAETGARVAFPYRPPAEYDLRVTFVPVTGRDIVVLVLPRPNGGFFDFGVWSGGLGFEGLSDDYLDPKFTRKTNRSMPFGRTCTVVVNVRHDEVTAYLNGDLVVKSKADYEATRGNYWTLDKAGCVGVGSQATQTVFSAAEVREVRGKGTVLKK